MDGIFEGWGDVQYDPRSGHPSEFRTEGNIKKVQQLLLSLRMVEDELDISKDTVQNTVFEDTKKGSRALYPMH